MASSSSSPPPISAPSTIPSASSAVPTIKHDVFLSFRGSDIRSGFLSHLCKALLQKKINYFVDDEKLEEGEEISPALFIAIEQSKISLVIFSKNYATSKWCLEELTQIIEFKEKYKHIVVPIFYNIDPSNVRHQRGSYEKAFAKHQNRYDINTLQKWRSALEKAANISGFVSSNKTEATLIEEIVQHVFERLYLTTDQSDLEGLVGIDEHIAILESLLHTSSQDILIIGIWGMGGIGKTTIAEALFYKFYSEYEGSHFLHMGEEFKKGGQELQKRDIRMLKRKLLSKLLEDKDLDIDMDNGIPLHVKNRLRCKRILVVLDDINSSMQVENLTGGHKWFGPGSRIILTSRNKEVFVKECDEIYVVNPLKSDDAFQLFNMHAFRKGCLEMKQECYKLSREVIEYANNIPLVLKVLGSFLYDKNMYQWQSTLRNLKRKPPSEIQDVLEISYDGLDYDGQEIFLYLACFFNPGVRKEAVTFLLDACGYETTIWLKVLHDRTLITISDEGRISTHDLIRDMGREIVYRKSRDEPSNRSHLWDVDDVCEVLESESGTKEIKSISLDIWRLKKDLHLTPHAFSMMNNLKFLEFRHQRDQNHVKYYPCKVYFPDEGFRSIPNKLRYIHWDGCMSKSLLLGSCGKNLLELTMRFSKLRRLWDGIQISVSSLLNPDIEIKLKEDRTKELPKLKIIDLSFSRELVEFPDLSNARNLERVYLVGCSCLGHFPALTSQKLVELNLKGCIKLKSLGRHIFSASLTSSEISAEHDRLDLSETISSIRCIPKDVTFIGLHCLKILDLGSNSLVYKLPDNVGHLPSLESLDLSGTNVETLPSFNRFSRLRALVLRDCRRLRSLQELPSSIEILFAYYCPSLETLQFNLMPLSRQCNGVNIAFYYCPKLNEHAVEALAKHYLFRVPTVVKSCAIDGKAVLRCPGSKVPKCLGDYRTKQGSVLVTLELALLYKLKGFIFYSVFPPHLKNNWLTINMKVIRNGQELSDTCIRSRTFSGPFYTFYFNSEHVLMCPNLELRKENFESRDSVNDQVVEFRFEINDSQSRRSDEVKEWGVCPVYK